MPKSLYVFGYSLWADATALAVTELGYHEGEVTSKTLNLVEGANFNPVFLKLNPNGTVPTLEADGKVYTNTDNISYLAKNATGKVKEGNPSIIQAIHDDRYDPNFAILRDETELTAKGQSLQGMFLPNREAALENYSRMPEAEPYKSFYEPRLVTNRGLLAIFMRKVAAEVQAVLAQFT
ncbi:hypothetical protein B0H10DRAFT_2225584 [Mycena sp. CBHHK59/15]|nr:hypothetical protein B0H10DRAFT_2225584 [Mycena sp. CBHHK59/15]